MLNILRNLLNAVLRVENKVVIRVTERWRRADWERGSLHHQAVLQRRPLTQENIKAGFEVQFILNASKILSQTIMRQEPSVQQLGQYSVTRPT